jgi:hypothetical protein
MHFCMMFVFLLSFNLLLCIDWVKPVLPVLAQASHNFFCVSLVVRIPVICITVLFYLGTHTCCTPLLLRFRRSSMSFFEMCKLTF